jgi:cobalamin biosynthesis protein CobD/CbiB
MASSNAGWPMAAMAGALRVGLAKRGAYRLGTDALPSSPEAIGRAREVFAWAAAITVAPAAGVALLRRDGSA